MDQDLDGVADAIHVFERGWLVGEERDLDGDGEMDLRLGEPPAYEPTDAWRSCAESESCESYRDSLGAHVLRWTGVLIHAEARAGDPVASFRVTRGGTIFAIHVRPPGDLADDCATSLLDASPLPAPGRAFPDVADYGLTVACAKHGS